jgi:hypothetical protein
MPSTALAPSQCWRVGQRQGAVSRASPTAPSSLSLRRCTHVPPAAPVAAGQLTGPVPVALGGCTRLRLLDLSMNFLAIDVVKGCGLLLPPLLPLPLPPPPPLQRAFVSLWI